MCTHIVYIVLHIVYTVYIQCILSALKIQWSRVSTSMNTTGANWRLWSKRQLHSQRFANFLHCHGHVNLTDATGAWTPRPRVLVHAAFGLAFAKSLLSVMFWYNAVENSAFNNPIQQQKEEEQQQKDGRIICVCICGILWYWWFYMRGANHIGAT